MTRLVPLVVTLPLFVLAMRVEAQTENLALDAKLFARADAVAIGKRTATRSGPLQPADSVAVATVLKNRTDQQLDNPVWIARGEFSPPVPDADSFIYLMAELA